ncbi:general odorant-binding protein 69a [Anastrepha obliqua]|uniref:general odorant-binding protein 69a n=1 Tax=Anastrepha obliqua TaxID=95512 RepID=UPI0024094B7A|nr:general odorant-binding protein 69a [Anastrepha obliqua]
MNYKQTLFLLLVYQCYFLARVKALEIPPHMKSGAKKLSNICMKEIGLTEDMFQEVRKTGQLPSDNRFKCFLHCMLDKIGLIDKENIVHLDNILELLPPEFLPIIEQLHTTCGTKSGADGCETAFLTVECYINTNPVILKLVFVTFSD